MVRHRWKQIHAELERWWAELFHSVTVYSASISIDNSFGIFELVYHRWHRWRTSEDSKEFLKDCSTTEDRHHQFDILPQTPREQWRTPKNACLNHTTCFISDIIHNSITVAAGPGCHCGTKTPESWWGSSKGSDRRRRWQSVTNQDDTEQKWISVRDLPPFLIHSLTRV